MNHKTLRKLYWIATIIFALWLIGDGLAGVFQVQAGKDSLVQLGYPMYVLVITGVAKVLAAIAILQTRYRTIKEWAFAGYAIDCLGAAASWLFIGGNTTNAVMAIVFLAIMFIPYYLWKRTA
ncbi:MAG: DoxX family protein [Candidatus Paceibacterota bacterium]